MTVRYYGGIDPGFGGAIALVDELGKVVDVTDMPVIKVGTRNQINVDGIVRMMKSWDEEHVHVGVEVQQPFRKGGRTQGVVSTGSLMFGYGVLVGVLDALSIVYELIPPKDWQAKMLPGRQRTKESSLACARGMYPRTDLSRKKDHGRAEALLIAEYMRRTRGLARSGW